MTNYQTALASYPPPNNITLSEVDEERITFTWSPVPHNCPAVHFNINTSNCDQYLDTTNSFSVTKTMASLPLTCTVTIQTVVCGNIFGSPSEPFQFMINGQ